MIRVAKNIFTLLLIVAMFVGVYFVQRTYDNIRLIHIQTANIPINNIIEPTVPSADAITKMTLGFNTVVADGLWLSSIQYYGGGDPQGKYRQLAVLMDDILAIDPKFSYPYSFAGLVLPQEGFSDEAIRILTNGQKILPDSWSIPYDIGTIYFINKRNALKAAEYYQLASTKPGAPAKTKYYSAVQFDTANDYQTAYNIFKDVAENSDNEYFKGKAQLFMAHYQLLNDLENIVQAFKQKEHRFPTTLDELVTKKIVESIPDDPLGRKILYDNTTGRVTTEFKK